MYEACEELEGRIHALEREVKDYLKEAENYEAAAERSRRTAANRAILLEQYQRLVADIKA